MPLAWYAEFEHILEAERAVRERDGYVYRGVPLQVMCTPGLTDILLLVLPL